MAIDLSGGYDEQAEARDFEPIPAGEYLAEIVEAERQEISRNNDYGDCLNLTWKIIKGEHSGRLVFHRLNLWSENMRNNDLVVQIANAQFAEIRGATGKKTPRDTDELLHIPCLIKVVIHQDKNKEYDPRNEIRRVKESGKTTDESLGAEATPWKKTTAASRAGILDKDMPF